MLSEMIKRATFLNFHIGLSVESLKTFIAVYVTYTERAVLAKRERDFRRKSGAEAGEEKKRN